MIPVLIVDDEYLLRSLIRNSINWSEQGFEIVGEAADGEQALDEVEKTQPQLMIVDINIPFINGLQLSQIVRDKYPHIKIIILTGYEDFEYAKEAIKAGVLNYILKPIDSEEFKKVLFNARNLIINENAQRKYISRLKQEAESGYTIAKREFLNTLISGYGKEDKENFRDKIEYFNINITSENITIIVCEIDHYHEKWTDKEERKLWSYALYNITEELFSGYESCIVFQDPQNRVVIILNGLIENKEYFKVCNEVLDKVKTHLDYSITIGVGTNYQNYDGIYLSYNEAIKALEHKFFKGNDCIIEYEEIAEDRKRNDIFIIGNKDKIIINLRTGNSQKLTEQIDKVFDEMVKHKYQKQYIQMTAIEIASIAIEFAIENNLQVTNILKTEKDIFDIIKSRETIKEIIDWLKEFYQQILKYLDKNTKSSTLMIVEKAKRYIESNYSQPYLTLEEIADSIFVNATYISNIFKKELKYSIIEYLTQYRLKKAKELMDNDKTLQIIEIANLVGYTDPYYFSKCFKKKYGLPPSKYIKKKLS